MALRPRLGGNPTLGRHAPKSSGKFYRPLENRSWHAFDLCTQPAILPAEMEAKGLNEAYYGVVVGIFYLGLVIGSFILGKFIGKIGITVSQVQMPEGDKKKA